jgi:predicted DNA-binding protein (UPF0251 family)
VNFIPRATYFKPAGVRLADLQEVTLSIEEAEAIRLKDLEGLEQEECASKMDVSRTTFARVLSSAREKIADALINGKAIVIDGGNYEMALRRFRCVNGHEWNIPFETMTRATTLECPVCKTETVMPISLVQACRFGGYRGRGHGRKGGWHQF